MAETKGTVSIVHMGSSGGAPAPELCLQSESVGEDRGSRFTLLRMWSLVIPLCSGHVGHMVQSLLSVGSEAAVGVCSPAWAST